MIAQIKGSVVEKTLNSLIIDVNGVGYEVLVPETELERVSQDETIKLFTHFHVRENSQELYGFTTHSAKELFELLITVNGVGPKGGLALMSLGDEHNIRDAIASENAAFLTGASGIGKKAAEKITIDLKDKVGVFGGAKIAKINSGDDALEALLALGYSQSQATQALGSVDQSAGVEDRIKLALKVLSQ